MKQLHVLLVPLVLITSSYVFSVFVWCVCVYVCVCVSILASRGSDQLMVCMYLNSDLTVYTTTNESTTKI